MAKKKKMKLASYLIEKGYLTVEQAQTVLKEQEKQSGVLKERFGRIAVDKGFITERALNRAIMEKEKEEAGY